MHCLIVPLSGRSCISRSSAGPSQRAPSSLRERRRNTALMQSSRLCGKAPLPAPTAATLFTPSSGTISAAAGALSRLWPCSSSIPTASADAISPKVDSLAKSSAVQQPELWSTTDWKQKSEPHKPESEPEPEPELEEDPPIAEPELEEDPAVAEPGLPPMFAHGDPDPRPVKRWTIRKLMPACGCGLLSGQWGTYKSFMALEIAAAVMTGQPFNTYLVRRQCGVLFLPAEGADEMRVRLEALVREKCGGIARAPFRWFEAVPSLLHQGGLELLVAMARQADASLQQEFGLPLGLVFIDTVAASAGYAMQGAESD